MSNHFSFTRFVSAVMLLDILLIASVSFSGLHADTLLASLLPGNFGPGMGPHMTGNRLLGALILGLNALLFLGAGFLALLGASRQALIIGSGGVWRLLYGTAGLSREDIAAASFAVAEEQKSEIRKLRAGRGLVRIGAVLLLLAFPAICFTHAKADVKGALLRDAAGPVANEALTAEGAALFAASEVLDAVLLDIPRVYDWRLSPLRAGRGHAWMRPFVLANHILAKLTVLALLFASWRGGRLRAYVLQMAELDTVPVTAKPAAPALAAAAPPAANDHHAPAGMPAVEAPPVEIPQDAGPQASAPDAPVQAGHEQGAQLVLETPAEAAPPSEPEAASSERPQLVPEHPQAEETAPVAELAVAPEEPPEPARTILLEAQPVEGMFPDSPLALHELRSPDEMKEESIASPAADNHEASEEPRGLPYKKTALHVLPEFDA